MRKKLKEYFRRFLSVLLCISIFCVFVISPVSASSVDDSGLVNLMDYNDSFLVNFEDYSHTLFLPFNGSFCYFEGIIFATRSFDLTISNWAASANVNVIYIGNNLYKFYVNFASSGGDVTFNFHSNNGKSQFSILSCFYSRVSYAGYQIPGEFSGYNTGGNYFEGVYDGDNIANIPAYTPSSTNESEFHYPYTVFIFPDVVDGKWKRWDKISVRLNLSCLSITSISGDVSGVNCIESLSYVDNDNIVRLVQYSDFDQYFFDSLNNTKYVDIMLDLRHIDKNTSAYPIITLTGIYEATSSKTSLGVIYDSFGFIIDSNLNPVIFWFRKLNSNLSIWFSTNLEWLTVISSKLDIIVGGEPAVSDARQTQEEINVSVNNQLVGAVEDWNTNIEVVETGYDMAVSKTTPALAWLATLADGIFNGMGWFGNVYFLVGLISVIMLVLSKSGLAHKIGSISRRKGD